VSTVAYRNIQIIFGYCFNLRLCVCVSQELELALEEERRAAEELRAQMTVLERKRIALQTEVEDLRGLLEAVSSSF